MKFAKLRSCVVAGVLLAATTGVATVATASTASATADFAAVATESTAIIPENSCENRAHHVHTTDTAPHHGWACWIDDGDKLRVCDTAPNDEIHAHGELWSDIGGVWLKIRSEDDGPDAGCDENSGGDITGSNRLKLVVCGQRPNQSNINCKQVIWIENE